MRKKARVIAFYLPQFHPVPENDEWHGRGFTEWTNVTKAKPLFKGHYQPILPSELGFYDLRVPETRKAQAELAKDHGIEAFCYWHYWFGNGKRILERPFNEVLKSGQPEFPFCLGWANADWTGVWYGMSDKCLMKQYYPGKQDYINHFYAILPAFKDSRYFTVNGKPLFFIYNPPAIPDLHEFIGLWQELAVKEGFPGLYFIEGTFKEEEPVYNGFNGSIQLAPYACLNKTNAVIDFSDRVLYKLKLPDRSILKSKISSRPSTVNLYQDLVNYLDHKKLKKNELPLVMPNWDNTSRSGRRGSVLIDTSPELFETMVKNAVRKVENIQNPEERIIFVEAWNEWAEGNYLEPDRKFGRGFLEAIKKSVY